MDTRTNKDDETPGKKKTCPDAIVFKCQDARLSVLLNIVSKYQGLSNSTLIVVKLACLSLYVFSHNKLVVWFGVDYLNVLGLLFLTGTKWTTVYNLE